MVEQERRAFVGSAEVDEALDVPSGGSLTFVAKGEQTGGALTAFLTVLGTPGEGPPFHLHVREDEVIYVLEGRLRVRLEETVLEAPAGSFVFLPNGAPHTWQNVSETLTRILVEFTPAAPGMERFFERAAELPADTPTAAAFATLAEDAGMVVLGPPLAKSHPRLHESSQLAAEVARDSQRD
jgi:quercetin dioxygenase-like cupin family protein